MSISESQLQTWSNKGATVTSSSTYHSIKNALEDSNSPLASISKEIYLQGSYRNWTNIYADSDVDIVVQLNKTFHRDISGLSVEDQRAYLAAHGAAEYLEQQFKSDVRQSLERYFGKPNVTLGRKVFIIKAGDGRFTADVLPALQFRQYNWFISHGSESYVEGIRFVDSAGNAIINYPKLHIDNGQTKNSEERTNGWYKPTVRLFKNIRNYLVDKNKIGANIAPSYFVECLVYNAPDNCFGASFSQTLRSVVSHLWTKPFNLFTCQNRIVPLFGGSSVQWNTDQATELLGEVIKLMN